ncbi:T9SS C-terminal target domain-containing protein [Flavobacterium sp. MR2016-29]|uniref:T9SS C-terminal target domain-containing protein n=1 Tax=Flavobacterium sp. MR2016-29 TaxID=2783795 RepID=UPI00188A9B9B|nr:T9SS C-terminal target domain-containing protein [Flavobacterium sp. MR2016-29]MBF4493528.1 T9SS C-terminal target domain-containing protein [Flavobacterium sp. MR2016-29]
MKKSILFFFLIITSSYSQISGCTDPLSKNYNSNATTNDGSCIYKTIKIRPQFSKKLSDSIKETSGLIAFNNLFWTHNDDHDKTIYGLDSLGNIRKKITLDKVINNEWEEISQDGSFIYIGDFGNNYAGNRSDLKILKIEKNSFLEGSPNIETISFTYSDQTDFSKKKGNTTNFDCEAFIVSKDSIYLFTKQWSTSKTAIYALPNQPGNHIAKFKENLDVKGLVTGATYLESKKLIVLCGYSKVGKPFLYLLYDFKNYAFLSGNKRRIELPLSFHQIEGIATSNGLNYYLTNENLVRKPIINVPQQIHHFDLSSILKSYLHK